MLPEIITEEEIRHALEFDQDCVNTIEAAFASLAGESIVIMPPVMQINIEDVHGQTCVKSAYTVGAPYFAVKLASTFHKNHNLNLPSASGLMLICSGSSGRVECILLDNGYLTALRTQAAGAVVARHLSRPESKIVGIVGAGRQARLQLAALKTVRPIERARVWSVDSDVNRQFARVMSQQLGIEVEVVRDAESAVRGADIVVTATPAKQPIVKSEWLSAGQHITAMGADAPGKSELHPEVLASVTRYVCDRVQQCRNLSELSAAIAAGVIASDFPAVELADVISGSVTGRGSDTDITVADLTGLGVQDTAIALLAWARVRESRGLNKVSG
ncbi:hypothetical protein [Phyllobacterium sp. UNC302MFCol5.2]|uniref:hypothetical protein n=1 Tax=Phyllobacterium sp. UNC302MFCol5.2 TaxID=1449065 RepID=UPI0004801FEA|nr:hypothetical protein [Phyllobacterium sp. UNC302MFCol5.2]